MRLAIKPRSLLNVGRGVERPWAGPRLAGPLGPYPGFGPDGPDRLQGAFDLTVQAIAGLMSDRPFEEVEQGLRRLRAAVAAMGTSLHEPFLQMAFLALPVIPHLRITDKGLVDVDKFALV